MHQLRMLLRHGILGLYSNACMHKTVDYAASKAGTRMLKADHKKVKAFSPRRRHGTKRILLKRPLSVEEIGTGREKDSSTLRFKE